MTETRYTAMTAIFRTFTDPTEYVACFMYPDGCSGESRVDRNADHAIMSLYDDVQRQLDRYYVQEERDALQDALEYPLFCYEEGFHRYNMGYRLHVEDVYQDSEHFDMRAQVRRDLAARRTAVSAS